MLRTGIAFLVVGASVLTLMGQGANAAPPNPIGMLTVGSSLVLQTHGCHKLCAPGPYGSTYEHRHALFSCAPRRLY